MKSGVIEAFFHSSFDQYGFNIHGYEEENPEAPLVKMQRRLDRQVHIQEAQVSIN